MQWRWGGLSMKMVVQTALLFMLFINSSDAAQHREDTTRPSLYLPAPSAESLQALAQAMGAAGFEAYTEGKAPVKRLIPAVSQPHLDVVEHQGVIGKAGLDFPAFPNIPFTGFNCKNVPTGYYADLETDCQVFHVCDTSRKISFLCPNGTIFSQSLLICDWWFKVDCASAPALYESSAEYYSSEQQKTHRITQSLSKNVDHQQIISDTNLRPEPRKAPTNISSTTERLLRHRQRLQNNHEETKSRNSDQSIAKATSHSFQTLFTAESNIHPTQGTEATIQFQKRRINLVQLVGNASRPTQPTDTEMASYRTTASPGDFNSLKEMQVAEETASFAINNNRKFLKDYNENYRPYPVYTPNLPVRQSKTKSNPTLTTLYDIRGNKLNLVAQESTTKRPSLIPYTKSYSSTLHQRRELYTRPGVSFLKEFIKKEKNKTRTTTEKVMQPTERSDYYRNVDSFDNNQVTIDTKGNFDSVTKIPETTRSENSNPSKSSPKYNVFSASRISQFATEPSYQERRERLMRKLNLDTFGPTEATIATTNTEKFYGDLPNRPGLVVPPSLTPKTLHTLAIYYATALDSLSATSPTLETETTTHAFDDYENVGDELPALFSRHTINKYSNLFGHGSDNMELLEDIKLNPNGTPNELADDLAVQQSQNSLATSPQIRELAQVFTHALSAYLQDPVQFRKVLSEIRPTHPSFGDMLTTTEDPYTEPATTVNEEDDEILGFSDENKARSTLASLRDGKAINFVNEYTTGVEGSTINIKPTTIKPYTETPYTNAGSTTSANPIRCCGRVSASYTSASTSKESTTTPIYNSTTLVTNVNNYTFSSTESSYIPKYGGFQNNTLPNDSPYGKKILPTESKPLSEYVEITNLPTAWGVDALDITSVTNAHQNVFESKKIQPITIVSLTTPIYFTKTDSLELENEEELQRAHSQSFVTTQNNKLRQSKQINYDDKIAVKKPSEELEVPTILDLETTTVQTTQMPPAISYDNHELFTTVSTPSSYSFTSPDNDETTYQFQWPSTSVTWQSTVIDPITLNDNLSPLGPEQQRQQPTLIDTWTNTTTTISREYKGFSEPAWSSSDTIEITTSGRIHDERISRLLRDPTSTETAQEITTIADEVVEKAKEIMGHMNATTTEKLMNVMKKTKSKTVRRLILLLVQTCDDDHNTTAEASKKALLEALMAVSQKDMEEIAKEEGIDSPATVTIDKDASLSIVTDVSKSTERQRTQSISPRQEIRSRHSDRRGNFIDPSAVNSLSNPSTPAIVKQLDEVLETAASTTPSPRTSGSFRGAKKFQTRTSTAEPTPSTTLPIVEDSPKEEGRTATQHTDLKSAADTRALELLRSLYTIAARWG